MAEVSEEQLSQYSEVFKIFDKDGDGNITKQELAKVMLNLGHDATQEQIELMISEVDKDGNGEIGFDEFVQLMVTAEKKDIDSFSEKEEREKLLQATFKKFDSDGSGKISLTELKAAMREMGDTSTDEEIAEMMAEADENGDGEVDFHEFKAMMG